MKKSIKDLGNLQGKTVLMRVDFNVPLKDGEITEVKGNYFKKISKNMDLLISYGNYGQRPAIDVYNVFVKKNGERTDNYLYLEKYNGKYSKKLGRLLLLDEIKPLYEQERVLKDDASIPLEMIKK